MAEDKLRWPERMMNTFGGKVRLVGKLWSWVQAKVNAFFVDAYRSAPSVSVPADSKKASFILDVRPVLILHILRARCFTNSMEPIIRSCSVFVVNIMRRPRSFYMEPSKAMSKVENAIDFDAYISVFPNRSGNRSDWRSVARTNSPRKNSSFLLVVKQLAQAFYGKIGLSHDALLKLIGEKPARVESTCGLRYFNTTV